MRRARSALLLMLLLVLLLAGDALGADAGGEDGEVNMEENEEEGEGEDAPGENSKVAKSVEVWVPVLLGGVLLVSVVGWCSVNVYRASQDNLEETVDVHKIDGNLRVINLAAIHHRQHHPHPELQSSLHPSSRSYHHHHQQHNGLSRAGTGDVTPNDAQSVLEGAGGRGARIGARRGSYRGGVGGAGSSARGLGGHMFPNAMFEGDELQGKKAPGETGDTYQNPMLKRAGAVPKPKGGLAAEASAIPPTVVEAPEFSGALKGKRRSGGAKRVSKPKTGRSSSKESKI